MAWFLYRPLVRSSRLSPQTYLWTFDQQELYTMIWNILFMAPRIKMMVILNLLSSEFAETNERRFDHSFRQTRSKVSFNLLSRIVWLVNTLMFVDTVPSPCLWVGTTLGSVLVIPLGLPEGDGRKSNHVIVSPSGKGQLSYAWWYVFVARQHH